MHLHLRSIACHLPPDFPQLDDSPSTTLHPPTTTASHHKMHLLNLTLQPATAVSDAVVGSFSGKGQEILVVHGATRLEILKLNSGTGQCE